MIHLIVFILFFTGTAWAGDAMTECLEHKKGWPNRWEVCQELVGTVIRVQYRNPAWPIRECVDTIQYSGGMDYKSPAKPTYYQIRSIPLSEANEFLRKNPEYEPFGVFNPFPSLKGDELYLRRRVQP